MKNDPTAPETMPDHPELDELDELDVDEAAADFDAELTDEQEGQGK